MVEPFCLDEGRSLYPVKYSVATAIIRIIFDISVCLFVVAFIPPRLLHIYLVLNFINKMPINVFLCFLTPAIKITPR